MTKDAVVLLPEKRQAWWDAQPDQVLPFPFASGALVLAANQILFYLCRMDALDHLLQQKQIRPTAMRLLVLDYLLQQAAAVSLNDLETCFHRADRITLYRTLKTFEEKGLVHKIDDGTGSVKYARCQEDCLTHAHQDLHVHFNCKVCGGTFCLPKSRIPEIPLPDKFRPEEVRLIMKGVCGGCAG